VFLDFVSLCSHDTSKVDLSTDQFTLMYDSISPLSHSELPAMTNHIQTSLTT